MNHGALINLNATDDSTGLVSEAELLGTIAEHADSDYRFSGFGDFAPVGYATLGPAEACTEVGADAAPASAHGLDGFFARRPRLARWLGLAGLLAAWGLAGSGDYEAEQTAALAADAAQYVVLHDMSEVQP